MRLTPRRPPGRLNRKAMAFEEEITRLRAEGYSCSAIHEALLDAGVVVSKSTVQREVSKAARHATSKKSVAVPVPRLVRESTPAETSAPTSRTFATDTRTGKEIAASFVSGRITNPLFRQVRK